MKARTRFLVAAGVWAAGMCASLGFVSGAVGTAVTVPSVSGIWLGYEPATNQSPVWTFVLNNKAGSTRVTGTWQEFKLVGTVSPATGQATLVAGVQPGVTQTTDFHVKFVFKSTSTAQSNHPTFRGNYDYVKLATGQSSGTVATMRAVRCSYRTNAKAVALCG